MKAARQVYNNDPSLLALFYRGVTGRKMTDFTHVVPAPPKEVLTVFGGNMSIKEYRSSFQVHEIQITKPPMLLQIQRMEHVVRRPRCPTVAEQARANQGLHNVTVTNNPLRFKKKEVISDVPPPATSLMKTLKIKRKRVT